MLILRTQYKNFSMSNGFINDFDDNDLNTLLHNDQIINMSFVDNNNIIDLHDGNELPDNIYCVDVEDTIYIKFFFSDNSESTHFYVMKKSVDDFDDEEIMQIKFYDDYHYNIFLPQTMGNINIKISDFPDLSELINFVKEKYNF